MSGVFLPKNFALQSEALPHRHMETADGRGRVLWVQPRRPGAEVRLRVPGLLPDRFYRIRPGDRHFTRTDRDGVLRTALTLEAGTLIAIEPVI